MNKVKGLNEPSVKVVYKENTIKTIIAGSRTINNLQYLEDSLSMIEWEISEIVSGTAKGVDTLGEDIGLKYNIPVKFMAADWKANGKKAGFIRNEEMAKYADACVILWDGKSNGTKNMIELAKQYNLKLHIDIIN